VGAVIVRYNARLRNSDKILAYYEVAVGAGDEVRLSSRDRNEAITYVNNYEGALVTHAKTQLAPLKLAVNDFGPRGNSWTRLTISGDGASSDARAEIAKRAEIARDSLIYVDPRSSSEPQGLTADVKRVLDELHIEVKIPLMLKYGSCSLLNRDMREIIESIQGGFEYAGSGLRTGGRWNDDRALKPLLRVVPHDEFSVLAREPSDGLKPLENAVSEIERNQNSYRTCTFGLASLHEGLQSIDWFLSKRGSRHR